MVDFDVPAHLTRNLTSTDPIHLAGKKILAKHFIRLQSHEEGTIAGKEIEDLHQMRVATRRIRVCLQNMRSVYQQELVDTFLKDLSFLAGVLGPVRDIDTFVQFLEKTGSALSPEVQTSFDHLITNLKENRKEGLARIQEALKSERYYKFKHVMYTLLTIDAPEDISSPPVSQVAPVMLEIKLDKVMKFRNRVKKASPDQLHRLRIQGKRFRYMCEFFQKCYIPSLKAIIKDLNHLQELLGEWHDKDRDVRFLQERFDEIVSEINRPDGENSLNTLISHLKEAHDKALDHFHKFWRSYSLPENEAFIRYLINHRIK